ncbi:tetratricopeptide repeat protein [Hymenobacter elongatus]|uniref:Uncharacterized protein n=1 Tax=Hymenobacter elongatus TaxID=877208 RepID=A0A4Z0PR66_9BACT|nr:tetratricopeptide repeat protein [Hymenobacter elongatus]TGE20210.1 hypothetical protein E5J99_01210 [Hymenobacter elongatus]
MRTLLLLLMLALPGWTSLTRIRDRNLVVEQAQAAYRQGNFAGASRLYRRALHELGATDEAVVLNLGHAYARAGDASQARAYYGRLLTSQVAATRSIARQQLAVLAAQAGEYAQAVSLLRQALLADASNAKARYNYEVVRDYLAQHPNEPRIPPAPKPQNQGAAAGAKNPANQPRPQPGPGRPGQRNNPNQPEDPRSAAEQRPDPSGQRPPTGQRLPEAGIQTNETFQLGQGARQRVAQGSQPGTTRGISTAADDAEKTGSAQRQAGTEQASLDETHLQTQRARLRQMNLSAGQARQLLDALRTAEEQYLQQRPRRAGQKADPKKPTW